MPAITFSPDNKVASSLDYPRLKLAHSEKVRVNCIETQPTFEYVHTIRAPKMLNGEVVYEQQKKQDGTTVEVPDFDFLGRFICIGDYGTIKEKGLDAGNCPVCEASKEFDGARAPERRFAMHILKYTTNSGSWDLAQPFTAQLIAWVYADQVFNRLVDLAGEWGDLRKHDLLLGPCTQIQYQKFDMQPAPNAQWSTSPERVGTTKQILANNRCSDISALIGRSASKDAIETVLSTAKEKFKQAFGKGSSHDDVSNGAVADIESVLTQTELSSVLTEAQPETSKQAKPSIAGVEDPFADLESAVASTPAQSGTEDEIDFSKLLDE